MNFQDIGFLGSAGSHVALPLTYSNIQLYLDASSLGYADATAIDNSTKKWTDLSGNSNHLVQATGTNQPLLKTAIINGKDVVRFDGSNDKLDFTSTITFAADFTIIVVGLYTIITGGTSFLFGKTTTPDRVIRNVAAGPTEQMGLVLGSSGTNSSTPPYAHGSAHMLVWKRSGSTITFRSNKIQTASTTDASSTGFNEMGDQGWVPGILQLNGDIGEVLFYSAHRSDAECDALYDNYFKAKWGLA